MHDKLKFCIGFFTALLTWVFIIPMCFAVAIYAAYLYVLGAVIEFKEYYK